MGCRELVATDEPAVVTEPLLDLIVVENPQGNRRFSDPSGADESDRAKAFSEIYCLLDQLVASKEDPWWRRRRFSRRAESICEIPGR